MNVLFLLPRVLIAFSVALASLPSPPVTGWTDERDATQTTPRIPSHPRSAKDEVARHLWEFGWALGHLVPQFNVYSGDPNARMEQLLNGSLDSGPVECEWMRVWFTDQPSHLTPERVEAGLQ